MKEYMKLIQDAPLFYGIETDNLDAMLTCLGGYRRDYQKGECVFDSEETLKSIGIVLTGMVHMAMEDAWGEKTILATIKEKELFGETFACGSRQQSMVRFVAVKKTSVLFLPFYKVIHSCNMSCRFHHRMIENMMRLVADKNVVLMEKVEVTSKKTLREKILTYLSFLMQQQNSTEVTIPFSRTELADYICSNRSALARELSAMQEEGLIAFEKDKFRLLI